jgi:hypothetical protein
MPRRMMRGSRSDADACLGRPVNCARAAGNLGYERLGRTDDLGVG